jgi:hypothetical protein
MKKTCPTCKSDEGIRTILWGMPSEEPDESKYFVGGCVVEDHAPAYKCIDCGWSGDFGRKKSRNGR